MILGRGKIRDKKCVSLGGGESCGVNRLVVISSEPEIRIHRRLTLYRLRSNPHNSDGFMVKVHVIHELTKAIKL